MRITKHGEEVLKKIAKPVYFAAFRPDLKNLIKIMWETM